MAVLSDLTLQTSRTQQTIQILALAFAGFIFNTTEFMPVGLLTDIATEFEITPAHVGWMLTIYAWVVASISLPLIVLTRHIERKRLMIGIFIVFILSHMLSCWAWSFASLLTSRIGVAVAHALFWSMTANFAIRLVPPERKPFALSMIATGTSLAMILGVPLGRVIGQILSWRVAFGTIAMIACLILLILLRLLPSLPSTFRGSLRQIPTLFKNKLLLMLYVFTFLMFAAHFTTYSYIEPLLHSAGHFSENTTTWLLLLFGIAAITGSFSFSKLSNILGIKSRLFLFTSLQLMAISLFPSFLSMDTLLMGTIIVWGAARIMMVLSLQSTILSLNENGGDFVMAVFSSIVNIGIGGGAFIGGRVINHFELTTIAYMSGLIGLFALIFLVEIIHHPMLQD